MQQIFPLILGQLGHQRSVQPMKALAGMAGLLMARGRNVDFAVHAHAVVRKLHLREYVPDMAGVLHIQIDLPIQPAVGHVVDDTPKGRNVQLLPAVKAHGQKVILLRELAGEVYGEGRIAAAVRTNQLAVEIHLGLMGSPQERQT